MTGRLAIPLAALALAGCSHALAPSDDAGRWARLDRAVDMGLVTVKPLQVVEDSRCPQNVTCIWAGTVRVRTEIEPPIGGHVRTLTLGEPQQIAGGTLLLEEVRPHTTAGEAIDPADYRFFIRYTMPKRH